MRRSSRPTDASFASTPKALILAACLAGLAHGSAAGAAQVLLPAAADVRLVIEPPEGAARGSVNPAGRAVVLTVPAMDGETYLGDVTATITADERVELSARRLAELLAKALADEPLQRLRSAIDQGAPLSPQQFADQGVVIRYDPQTLALHLDIAPSRRAARAIVLGEGNRPLVGAFDAPARVSAYLNVRGSLDYVEQGVDDGLNAPVTYLDGAVRVGGVVLESEANWQPGGIGPNFQRRGSRLVHDDQDRLIRWTAGDLLTISRGFQTAPDIAGVGLYRSYSVLQPQTIIRPRGDRSFRLERPSTVEVWVNGQLIRRLQLEPGTYDLRDFPFAQGSNDIRLTVTDDAGRTQSMRFNIFLDQSQLADGLSEFGLYAGVLAPLGAQGPHYTDDLAFSGFYRRGISDALTLGVNAQADPWSRLVGGEAVFGTAIGSVGTYVAASHIEGAGFGWASVVTFERPIVRSNGQSDTLTLSAETRSPDFAPIGVGTPVNPFKYELSAGYSRAIGPNVYAALDGRFSKGRDSQKDVGSLRGTLGWRISDRWNFTADLRYQRDDFGTEVGGLLSLTYQIGRYSSLRADYDTRFNRTRLSWQGYRGSGTGAYNFNVDLERSDFGAGATVNGNYFANRAELGFSHFGTFENAFGPSIGQRTSFRFGSSLAYADGAVSVGRPIYDSFAIVKPHRTLDGVNIRADPSSNGAIANTGALAVATHPSISSYSERTITVGAPEAPPGADLGSGSFRLYPPYRAGYRLTVGSDYYVSAIGRLLDRAGEPLKLIAGTATELAHPDREPVPLFTNAAGRFGATGLAPGRWRIVMLDDDSSTYEIDIPEETQGTIQVGDLRPSG